MKILGLLLLLFGLGTLAIHFLEQPAEWLAWFGNSGENAASGIRGGSTVLGLVLIWGTVDLDALPWMGA